MIKKTKILFIIFLFLNFSSLIFSAENFFEQGQQKYNEKKFDDSKFLFQRSIIFNPKDTKSYLYLAKIFKLENNEKEEEKNINTVLLLDSNNEEAIYILMEIQLKKSNYLKVKELSEKFVKVCKDLCKKNKFILESLKNLEPKNES
jgi:tetratricopeptide (TPR) repeat protein